MKTTGLKLVLIAAVMLLIGTANAEFYRYVDENGNVRFTDDLSVIPREQREKVQSYDAYSEEIQSPDAKSEEEPDDADEQSFEQSDTPPIDFDKNYQEFELKGAELEKQHQALENEKQQLAKEKRSLLTKKQMKAFNHKIRAFNKKVNEYNQQRSLLESEVEAYNADAVKFMEGEIKKYEIEKAPATPIPE